MSKDVYAEVTFKILEQLDKGTVPWKKPWRTPEGAHRNLQSGRPYRGVNQLLLSLSGYQSPYWTTFNAMKKQGGHLRTDEGKQESTLVVLWKRGMGKCTDSDCPRCHGNGTRHKVFMMIRYYYVFNVEQTTLPIPDPPKSTHEFTPVEHAAAIEEEYVERSGIGYSMDDLGRAYYSPAQDEVHLPLPKWFKTTEGFYNTMFHEFGHSTGHKDRLARKGIMDRTMFGDDDYSDEELVAEMTAAMLMAEVGLFDDAALDQSSAYIDHWRSRISEDSKLIVMAAARAQRAADLILGVQWESEAQDQKEEGVTA